jgi:hypothetical protein
VADINIDRKSGPGPWVWVAGLVVVALLIWGVMEFTGDDRRADDARDTTPAAEQFPEQQPVQPLPQEQPYAPPADPAAPGTTGPGTTDPGTTDPGTTDPGMTGPGNPGTTGPGTTGVAGTASVAGARQA